MSGTPEAPKARVLIVDDHAMVREGLAARLSSSGRFQVAGTCGTADEALQMAGELAPDAILLDYDLGDTTGAAYLTAAARDGIRIPVLVVSGWLNQAEIRRLVNLGVMGIISKRAPAEQLLEAAGSVARGASWFEPGLVVSVVRGEESGGSGSGPASLSIREKAAIRCLLEGMSNKEIASEMEVSESSVKAVLQNLFEKAGVRTRAQLVRVAMKNAWG